MNLNLLSLDRSDPLIYSYVVEFDPKKCPLCKGKAKFHIGDRVEIAGNYSHFALAYLADAANMAGLRVSNGGDKHLALVTRDADVKSDSIKRARKVGTPIMSPDEFKKALSKLCKGNIPKTRNPLFASLIVSGGRMYPIGLSTDQEKLLAKYLKQHGLLIGKRRIKTVVAGIATNDSLQSGSALILKSEGVPVYSFNKVLATLKN